GRGIARGLRRLGGARAAGAQSRRRGEGSAVGAGLARRHRCLAGARLHADLRPPRRRGLSFARGGRPVAPLSARNVFGGADAGGRAMNDVAARIRGAVHAAVGHDSGVVHVTGAARYLDDVPTVPGTLEAALVLSPHAHARIRRVDLSAALAAPGVLAAITAADIPGKNDIAPIRSDEPALAADVVEYDGHPVAAIAAATLDQARAAAKLAAIDYEPLPPGLTIEEAMARESIISPPQIMVSEKVEEALACAPHRLAGELRCGGQDHFYLEGQIALATPGEASDMHVWSSTQHPTEVQRGVAHLLGLPFNAVTVEVRRMGGAF